MTVAMVQQRLEAYACQTPLEEDHAVREITQEIVLAALGRTDFFQHAAFHGGTCLRIFHQLNRFSEDLDFALKAPDPAFDLQPYLRSICDELTAYGYAFEIQGGSRADPVVRKAMLKDDAIGRLLTLDYRPVEGPLRKIRVRIEVDTRPPAHAEWQSAYLDFPFLSAVAAFDLPSLFAGKLHALICREYVKGRDWYDLIWYIGHRVRPNYHLLAAALEQTGHHAGGAPIGRAECIELLADRIEGIDWMQARADVERFVKPQERPSLALWNKEVFLAQCLRFP